MRYFLLLSIYVISLKLTYMNPIIILIKLEFCLYMVPVITFCFSRCKSLSCFQEKFFLASFATHGYSCISFLLFFCFNFFYVISYVHKYVWLHYSFILIFCSHIILYFSHNSRDNLPAIITYSACFNSLLAYYLIL